MKKEEKKRISASGGLYRGIDVPIKLLDTVIFAGIAVIAVLIFGSI